MVNPEPRPAPPVSAPCAAVRSATGDASPQMKPRTSSIDDRDRWAHDHTHDWLTRPHRAIRE